MTGPGIVKVELTANERLVLQHFADGMSVKESAKASELSEKTVESYRKLVRNKLGIKRLANLVKYAIREGIASPGIFE